MILVKLYAQDVSSALLRKNMIFSLSLSITHGMEPNLVMENVQMYLESGSWKNTSIDPDQNMYRVSQKKIVFSNVVLFLLAGV